MKTIQKHHPINEKHFAVVEMRENYIYVWIAEWRKYLFGLITTDVRISAVKHFSLWVMKEEVIPACCGISTETSVDGRIMRLTNHRKNIDTFDINKEIEIAYNEFIEAKKATESFNRKLETVAHSI